MKNWQAAVRNWIRKAGADPKKKDSKPPGEQEGEKIKKMEREAAPPPKEWNNLVNQTAAKKGI